MVWPDLGQNPGLPVLWRTLYPLGLWTWVYTKNSSTSYIYIYVCVCVCVCDDKCISEKCVSDWIKSRSINLINFNFFDLGANILEKKVRKPFFFVRKFSISWYEIIPQYLHHKTEKFMHSMLQFVLSKCSKYILYV